MRNYLNQFKSKFFYVFVSIMFLLSSCSQGDFSDIYDDNEDFNSTSICRTKSGDPEPSQGSDDNDPRVYFDPDAECVPWALAFIKNKYDGYITQSTKIEVAIALCGYDYWSDIYKTRSKHGFSPSDFCAAAGTGKLGLGSYSPMNGKGSDVISRLSGNLDNHCVLVRSIATGGLFHLQFAASYDATNQVIQCNDLCNSSSTFPVNLSDVLGLIVKN
jgi:hypothetical protein